MVDSWPEKDVQEWEWAFTKDGDQLLSVFSGQKETWEEMSLNCIIR